MKNQGAAIATNHNDSVSPMQGSLSHSPTKGIIPAGTLSHVNTAILGQKDTVKSPVIENQLNVTSKILNVTRNV